MWSRSIHYPSDCLAAAPAGASGEGSPAPPSRCRYSASSKTCRSHAEAEAIVAAGEADMVGEDRAHIADPAVSASCSRGAPTIRTCIYCNESCFGRQQRFGDISCVYNPRSGREHLWPLLGPELAQSDDRASPGDRWRAGGAGSGAGHGEARPSVTLHERDDRLGGQVRRWRARRRGNYVSIIEWLERQARGLGVDVRLRSGLTPRRFLPGARCGDPRYRLGGRQAGDRGAQAAMCSPRVRCWTGPTWDAAS